MPALTLIAALALGRGDMQGGVYPVAALRKALARHPDALVGRTIRVEGVVPLPLTFSVCSAGAAGCADAEQAYLLYPPDNQYTIPGKRGTLEFDYEAPSGTTLPLVMGQADPLPAALRRLPVLGSLAPAPQRLRFGAAATYRVRVQAAPSHTYLCLAPPCYLLVLVDAAQESP